MSAQRRRCPHARSKSGKSKLIFDTEDEAREHGRAHPEHEGQNVYFCARGDRLHWHLTHSENTDIPGLKRGKFGRRGGSQRRGKRGLTYRPRNG